VTPPGVDTIPIATDLEAFRGRYKYHLEDPALGSLLANTVVYNTWDDHEITDDWGPRLIAEGKGQLLEDGQRAFFEYWPVCGPPSEPRRVYRSVAWGAHAEVFILDCRSYRAAHMDHDDDPNTTPQMEHILGEAQKKWLIDGLSASSATWKFICTSIPISYPTGWPRPEETGYDGWADGNPDGISGPEIELMSIFEHIRDTPVSGVIFISGDVHFPFAISYDPFKQGKPLIYEIAATPFHSLCLPPPEGGPRDLSFNPTSLFAAGTFAGSLFNFGHVVITDDGSLECNIRDVKGESIYKLELTPP